MSHSQFNFPVGVEQGQNLQPYSVEVSDEQILVQGPDRKKCREIAIKPSENSNPLLPGLSEPKQSVSSTPAPHVSSNTEPIPSISKGKKSRPTKQKTEPGNCWVQFCHFKKNEAIMKSGDKNAEYKLSDVSNEWKAMSKEERAVFVEMAEIDKRSVVAGGNFRAGRKRNKTEEIAGAIKVPRIKNKKKKQNKNTAEIDKKYSEDFSDVTIKFLDHLETLDKDIEIQELKHKAMMEELMNEKVGVTKQQCKLDQVNSEVDKSTERYDQLVKKHAGCKSE